jgi:hypothetical protein
MFGQRFRLTTPTLAIFIETGRETISYIPAGAEIVVNVSLGGEAANRQVNAEWEDKTVRMFAVDILERGKRIQGANA